MKYQWKPYRDTIPMRNLTAIHWARDKATSTTEHVPPIAIMAATLMARAGSCGAAFWHHYVKRAERASSQTVPGLRQ